MGRVTPKHNFSIELFIYKTFPFTRGCFKTIQKKNLKRCPVHTTDGHDVLLGKLAHEPRNTMSFRTVLGPSALSRRVLWVRHCVSSQGPWGHRPLCLFHFRHLGRRLQSISHLPEQGSLSPDNMPSVYKHGLSLGNC